MREEPVELAGRTGTLTIPDGPGPYAAMVPLHPASGGSRDHFMLRHLARVLPPIGVAVLRYDRRGENVPLETQADDALAAVGALHARNDIDRRAIGLWGFSQGAWVAPIAAARSDAVRWLALVASTGVSPAEQMRYGTAYHLRHAGHGEDAVDRLLRVRRALEEYNRGQLARGAAQAAVDAVAREPWFDLAYVQRELPADPGFWPDADFDPAVVFARVHVPTLLFYGENDEWMPIDASIAAWRRALPGREPTVVRLRGTAHHPTRGGVEDERELVPEYTEALLAWVRERVAEARP